MILKGMARSKEAQIRISRKVGGFLNMHSVFFWDNGIDKLFPILFTGTTKNPGHSIYKTNVRV